MITSQTLDAILAIGSAVSDVAKNTPTFKKGLESLRTEQSAIESATALLKEKQVEVADDLKKAQAMLADVEEREAVIADTAKKQAETADKLKQDTAKFKTLKEEAVRRSKEVASAAEILEKAEKDFDAKSRIISEKLEKRESAVSEREKRADRIAAAMQS